MNSYLYDGEERICAVNGTFGMYGYLYDGDGDRIAKGTLTSFSCNLASNGFALTSSYVVDKDGEQAAEIQGGTPIHANVFADGKLLATYYSEDTYFALTDWLGTKRAVASTNGCSSTYASLAYGDNLTPSGNCPDVTEHHFTGKERDSESGNDFFLARYYSSTTGRFTSPDWAAKEEAVPYAAFNNPQSLNLYGYVTNNPLSSIDKNGHEWICVPCAAAAVRQFAADHPRTMEAAKGIVQVVAGGTGVVAAGSAEVGSSGIATVGVIFGVQASTALATKGVANIIGAATNTDVSEGTKGIDAVANPAAQITSVVTGGDLEKGAEAGAIGGAIVAGANAPDILTGGAASQAVKAAGAADSIIEGAVAIKNVTQQTQQQNSNQQSGTGNCSTQNSCN